MYKFVTIYRQVDDQDKVETFFSTVHLPLSEQLPDLQKSEVSRVTGKPGGKSRFSLMYELYFESREAFEQALLSEPGLALMKALRPWSEGKIITWFYADAFEE